MNFSKKRPLCSQWTSVVHGLFLSLLLRDSVKNQLWRRTAGNVIPASIAAITCSPLACLFLSLFCSPKSFRKPRGRWEEREEDDTQEDAKFEEPPKDFEEKEEKSHLLHAEVEAVRPHPPAAHRLASTIVMKQEPPKPIDPLHVPRSERFFLV